jgi:hypothetical protein
MMESSQYSSVLTEVTTFFGVIVVSDTALTGWALYRSSNVSPVKYKQGFYIPEDGILHSHRRKNFKSGLVPDMKEGI